MLCTLGWGCVGSARKTAKPTVLGRDTHHSRAQCRTGLSMEAAAGPQHRRQRHSVWCVGRPQQLTTLRSTRVGGTKGARLAFRITWALFGVRFGIRLAQNPGCSERRSSDCSYSGC